MAEQQSELKDIAEALKDIVDGTITGKTSLTYFKDPEVIENDIIEYNSRMRVFGLEKFNDACFIATVNFYASEADRERHNALGALVVYLAEEHAEKFLKALGHPIKLDEEEERVQEETGAYCKDLAEQVSNSLNSRGYGSLVLSEPELFRSSVPDGVEFSYDQYKMYELYFYLWKDKILAVDFTFAAKK